MIDHVEDQNVVREKPADIVDTEPVDTSDLYTVNAQQFYPAVCYDWTSPDVIGAPRLQFGMGKASPYPRNGNGVRCFTCGGIGHVSRFCQMRSPMGFNGGHMMHNVTRRTKSYDSCSFSKNELSVNAMEFTPGNATHPVHKRCYLCGSGSHLQSLCKRQLNNDAGSTTPSSASPKISESALHAYVTKNLEKDSEPLLETPNTTPSWADRIKHHVNVKTEAKMTADVRRGMPPRPPKPCVKKTNVDPVVNKAPMTEDLVDLNIFPKMEGSNESNDTNEEPIRQVETEPTNSWASRLRGPKKPSPHEEFTISEARQAPVKCENRTRDPIVIVDLPVVKEEPKSQESKDADGWATVTGTGKRRGRPTFSEQTDKRVLQPVSSPLETPASDSNISPARMQPSVPEASPSPVASVSKGPKQKKSKNPKKEEVRKPTIAEILAELDKQEVFLPPPPREEKPQIQFPKKVVSKKAAKKNAKTVADFPTQPVEHKVDVKEPNVIDTLSWSERIRAAHEKNAACIYSVEFLMAVRQILDLPSRGSQIQFVEREVVVEEEKEWRREVVAPLTSGPQAWMSKQRSIHDEGCDEDTAILRQMKSILNKLTVEKFDKLYVQLISEITKAQHIESLVDMIFDKATTQHHFIKMYSDMCFKLDKWSHESSICSEEFTFKTILLDRCQKSFETNLTPPENLSTLEGEDFIEARLKYKEKMLGNMQFIGELLKNHMLRQKVFQVCCNQLLAVKDEPTLETLCIFLHTVGPFMDHSASQNNIGAVDNVFGQIKELSETFPIMRVRFLLRNVIEKREKRWIDGSRASAEVPKRISELQKKDSKKKIITNSGNEHWEVVSDARRSTGPKLNRRETPAHTTCPAASSSSARRPSNLCTQESKAPIQGGKEVALSQSSQPSEDKSSATIIENPPAGIVAPDLEPTISVDEQTTNEKEPSMSHNMGLDEQDFIAKMQNILIKASAENISSMLDGVRGVTLPVNQQHDICVDFCNICKEQTESIRAACFSLFSVFEQRHLVSGVDAFLKKHPEARTFQLLSALTPLVPTEVITKWSC